MMFRNLMIFKFYGAIILVLQGAWLFAGCASAPHFSQEDQVAEVASPSEGLNICMGISPAAESDAGSPKVSVLLPWIRCFETLLRRFESLREDDEFVMFFRSLRSRYDYGFGDASVVKKLGFYDQAVRFAARRALHEKVQVSESLLRFMQKELPRYAQYLEARDDLSPAPGEDARGAREHQKSLEARQLMAQGRFTEFSQDWALLQSLPIEQRKSLALALSGNDLCGRYRFHAARLLGLRDLEVERLLLAQESQSSHRDLQRQLETRIQKIHAELLEEQQELKEFQTHVEKKRTCLISNSSSSPSKRKKPSS